MKNLLRNTLALVLVTAGTSAYADDFFIYPAQGQTAAQQQTDEGECFVWARDRTGFDPLAQTTAPPPQAQSRSGGAVRGAAGGAAIGAIAGDSDDAAKGAAIGALIGRSRQNRQNRAAQEQAQAQAAQTSANQNASRADYNRAYTACLEGRGYTVN